MAMSLNPKRYEIYLAELSPTIGAEMSKVRPVVVISQNEMNRNLETIVICPLTSKLHPQWQGRLEVTCAGKLAEVAVDQIRTISKNRLRKKLDQLPPTQAAQLRRLITQMYGE
jgi:mRNA interferase MazF